MQKRDKEILRRQRSHYRMFGRGKGKRTGVTVNEFERNPETIKETDEELEALEHLS
jgi:hypothetical protein